MAINGAASSQTGTAIALSTVANFTTVQQMDLMANPGNTGIVYLGTSGVTTAGVNAYVALEPGQAWSLFRRDASGGEVNLDPTALYMIGASGDYFHILVVT